MKTKSTTSTSSSNALAKSVLAARTPEDVKKALVLAKNELGELDWRDLGDRPNNAGTVQISSSAALAVVERVTNAIDGMLEMKAEELGGPIPDSPRAAAQEWFGVPADGLGAMDDRARRALAENIKVTLAESGEAARPTVIVTDRGIGQHPLDAAATLLSLNERNKVGKPYLQGAYGQGASATYRFARYTVVVMRRKPSLLGGRDDIVGWTIVWEDPGDVNVDKLPIYRYVVDGNGNIPVFDPALLDDPSWHGVQVIHVGYDLRGYNAAYTQPKNGAWALFHSALFDPVLPFIVGGHRSIDEKAAGRGSTRVVIGNAARLDNPAGLKGALSVGYSNSQSYDLGKSTGKKFGKFSIRYWVLQRPASSGSTSDPTASFVGPDAAITMTLAGQRQDAESRTWLKNRTDLPFLVKNLIVQIDVDDLAPVAKRELFSSTRERAVDGDLRELIYGEVAQVLRDDAELRRLEQEEREKALAQSTEQIDDKVRERLRKHIETRLKDKKRKVKRERLVTEPAAGGGEGRRVDVDDAHLPEHPTSLTLTRDPITIEQGRATTVWVEINAKNGYLPTNEANLTVSFDSAIDGKVVDVAKSRLLGGRSLWRLQAAADAPVGKFGIEAVMVTPDGVISTSGTLEVLEAKERKRKRKVTVEEPDNGPIIKWIRRPGWANLGWDEETVGEVRVSNDETLILLNRDQILLERALDRNKKLSREQVQNRETRYLFPVACGLFEQHRAAKDMKDPPTAEYVKGELQRLAEAVLLVIDQDSLADPD